MWDSGVPGFAIELPEAAAAPLSHHPLVDFVEEDAEWTLFDAQANAPWHLDRIDQRYLPLDGYYYQGCGSTDVYAYVLDTGVRASHHEFWTNSANTTSRVLPGMNFYPDGHAADNPCPGVTYYDQPQGPCGNQDKPCFSGGHGTAVASVLGGLTYGVAKGVKIIPVRTFSCTAYSDSVLMAQGLQWIYNDKPSRNGPAVLNISSGMDTRSLTTQQQSDLSYAEMWINKLVNERNITVVVAAGNQEISASHISPARMARGNGGKVISVGGSTNNDSRWHCNTSNPWETNECSSNPGSNYGTSVDIFAPAQNISAAAIKQLDPTQPDPVLQCCVDSDTAERWDIRSGTSFASPAVAGIAARLLMGSGATLTPDQVWSQIQSQATGDPPSTPPAVMQDPAPGADPNAGPLYLSPNRLLFQQGVARCRAVSH